MGEFAAGRWVIGLSLYFFVFFLIVFGTVNGASSVGIDVGSLSVSDPGFTSLGSNAFFQSNQCEGDHDFFCGAIEDEALCEEITGCSYGNSTGCIGVIYQLCEDFDSNSTLCEVTGCTYIDYATGEGLSVSQDDSYSMESITNSISFMAGFTANVGAPASFNFIWSFFLFLIPGLMLLYAIYMSLPFLH